MLIFVESINNYFWKFFRCTFWTFFKSSLAPTPLKLEVLFFEWVEIGKCLTLSYLNSKGKIIWGGGAPPPPTILDKNSPIEIGLMQALVFDNSTRIAYWATWVTLQYTFLLLFCLCSLLSHLSVKSQLLKFKFCMILLLNNTNYLNFLYFFVILFIVYLIWINYN